MQGEKQVNAHFNIATLMTLLGDYNAQKGNLTLRVVNEKWLNKRIEMTDGASRPVTTRWNDLHVVYEVSLGEDKDVKSIVYVTEYMLDWWGITVDTLHQDALENTAKMRQIKITTLQQAIMMEMEGVGGDGRDIDLSMETIYVVTNKQKMFGFTSLLYPGTLEKLTDNLGDFYILPSSVHEALIVPKSMGMEEAELVAMVRNVNAVEVSEDEWLADHIYEVRTEKVVSVSSCVA